MSEHGIEEIAVLTDEERAEIFRETASVANITEAVIEKDFWVCWALYLIFSNEMLSRQVLFKGGTSLSKCYGLIERFSEDIDLILDWGLLTDEEPYLERSNTQQDRFNKNMEANAQAYVKDNMLPQIEELMGEFCQFRIDEDKPRSIIIIYPKSFNSPYIKPEIELEIGPMSAMTPNSSFKIAPYCKDVVEGVVGDTNFIINAIEAKKTFWDKITILHVEAHRPENKKQPARYSRHYYDIYQMLNSEIASEAIDDLELLKTVVEFKRKFYPQNWAKYDDAIAGNYKLIPDDFRIELLKKDYVQMEEMIFGAYPDFDDILKAVAEFEIKLRAAHGK